MEHPITCADCGAKLDPSADPAGGRRPCPECGSTIRVTGVALQATVVADARMKGHSKHAPGRKGKHKWGREMWFGDEIYRKMKRWAKMERTADRDADYYRETFTDPKTGEVLHHCEEPLSEHRNRKKSGKCRSSDK